MNRVTVGENPEAGGQIDVGDLHLSQAIQWLDARVQFGVSLVSTELVLYVDSLVLDGNL